MDEGAPPKKVSVDENVSSDAESDATAPSYSGQDLFEIRGRTGSLWVLFSFQIFGFSSFDSLYCCSILLESIYLCSMIPLISIFSQLVT